jgi:hypothetical protein
MESDVHARAPVLQCIRESASYFIGHNDERLQAEGFLGGANRREHDIVQWSHSVKKR